MSKLHNTSDEFYFDTYDILEFDKSIAAHPWIDACNGSIMFQVTQLLQSLPRNDRVLTAIDVGAGSGQVARLLRGIPGLVVEACDVDPTCVRYFAQHPELASMKIHLMDFLTTPLPRHYDVAVCRGVYHHVPKSQRAPMLASLVRHCSYLVIADEAVGEYDGERQRIEHCQAWYRHVIDEATRRGMPHLASMEREFLAHESKGSADDGMDFKESPGEFCADARRAGVQVLALQRVGPWTKHSGGFFSAVLTKG